MKPVRTFIASCTGLLTLAAVIGIIDYANASKSGKLKTLYKDERPAIETGFLNKEIEVDDYSRGPIEAEPKVAKIDNLNNEVRNVKYKEEYSSKTKSSITKKAATKARKPVRKKVMKEDRAIEFKSFSRAPLRKFKTEVIAEAVIDSVNVQ